MTNVYCIGCTTTTCAATTAGNENDTQLILLQTCVHYNIMITTFYYTCHNGIKQI